MRFVSSIMALLSIIGMFGFHGAFAAPLSRVSTSSRIAVFDIETSYNLSEELADAASAAMRNAISKAGIYNVIDRDTMNIRLEGRQCRIVSYDRECFVESGQSLGVEKIVTGNIVSDNGVLYFLFFMIDAKTGAIENVAEDECLDGKENLISSTANVAAMLTSRRFYAMEIDPRPDFRNSREMFAFNKKIFETPGRDTWQKPESVVAGLPIKTGYAVADIGTGTGYFISRLSKAVGEKGTVYAVDVQNDMLNFVADRAKKEGLNNVRTVLATPGDPSLPKNSIDLLFLCSMYYEIRNNNTYLMRLKEILKKDGKLVIIDHKVPDLPFGPPLFIYDSLMGNVADNKIPRSILIPNILDINHYKSTLSPVGPTFLVRLPKDKVIKEITTAGFTLHAEHNFLPYQYFLVFSKK